MKGSSTLNSMNQHMNEQMDILLSRWVEGPQGFSLKRLIWENIINFSLSKSYSLSYTQADIVLGSSTINYKRFLYKDPGSMFSFQLNHHSPQISWKFFYLSFYIYIDRWIGQISIWEREILFRINRQCDNIQCKQGE